MFDKPFNTENPVSKCVIPRDKITVSIKSDIDASSDDEIWINTFCQENISEQKEFPWFCEIDKSFFKNELIQLNKIQSGNEIKSPRGTKTDAKLIGDDPAIENAINLITDKFKQESERIDHREEMKLQCLAEHIYGLLHAKYILTTEGLQKMREKFLAKHWGTCPRYYCYNNPVLPYGSDDKPGVSCVQFFCPVCSEVYDSSDKRAKEIDGAYFGPTFAIMFCKNFPELCSSEKPEQALRIHGFRIADYKNRSEFYTLTIPQELTPNNNISNNNNNDNDFHLHDDSDDDDNNFSISNNNFNSSHINFNDDDNGGSDDDKGATIQILPTPSILTYNPE